MSQGGFFDSMSGLRVAVDLEGGRGFDFFLSQHDLIGQIMFSTLANDRPFYHLRTSEAHDGTVDSAPSCPESPRPVEKID